VSVCEGERERPDMKSVVGVLCVCVRERNRKRESVCACVCACVCARATPQPPPPFFRIHEHNARAHTHTHTGNVPPLLFFGMCLHSQTHPRVNTRTEMGDELAYIGERLCVREQEPEPSL